MKPSRLVKKSYKERYYDAVASVFKSENIKIHPATDIFYSQWLKESVAVQYSAHKLGVKSAILYIGDDVIVWPKTNKNAFDEFKDNPVLDMRFVAPLF